MRDAALSGYLTVPTSLAGDGGAKAPEVVQRPLKAASVLDRDGGYQRH